ncbi:DUF7117 family protein [Halobellus marinus]|jgi:hypothetical protein|uniref:DUF7117 family protein n=1 Tax=Halobellus TaxID=1073986 RepID=UPI0028AA0C0A|nr:hypothetical protein [Halobellus sp. DFY28]
MEIRGRRRCTDCGREWSYYDTGRVDCPDCGSLRSVGLGDRERHTDGAVELDLSDHRAALGEHTAIEDVAADLKTTLRDYVRRRGFLHGGELRPVDETVLAAAELLHAVDVFDRTRDPDDDARLYVLELLRGADSGERPAPDTVPASMTAARGLAYAEVLDGFITDVGVWLEDNPDTAASKVRERLDTHVRRVEAIYGDVPAEESEALVRAARELVAYLHDDEETALARARDRLSRLG